MCSCKQQRLSWIIILISAAAVCVSCQQQGIISTLREGNRTCPEEEVIFNCTLRGSLALAWRSPGYIADGSPLQFSVASMPGVDVPSMINGMTTATATLTRNTIDNGEQVLMSTLRTTATVASVVTCSGTSGDIGSIGFSISAVPGAPQRIIAAEISRPIDNICIILVVWDPPANSDASDIDQYIIYVPSRNIRDTSSSTISTLSVTNCGDDIRVQVAAVNRIGCVGMNSSEVPPVLLDDIPILTASTDDGSGDGCTTYSLGAVVGIAVGSAAGAVVIMCCLYWIGFCCIINCCDRCFDCYSDYACDSCYNCLSRRRLRKAKEPAGDDETRPPLDYSDIQLRQRLVGPVYIDPAAGRFQYEQMPEGDIYQKIPKKCSENRSSEQDDYYKSESDSKPLTAWNDQDTSDPRSGHKQRQVSKI